MADYVTNLLESEQKIIRSIADGSGLSSMTFGEQTFTFATVDEKLKALSFVRRELALRGGGVRFASTRKGV